MISTTSTATNTYTSNTLLHIHLDNHTIPTLFSLHSLFFSPNSLGSLSTFCQPSPSQLHRIQAHTPEYTLTYARILPSSSSPFNFQTLYLSLFISPSLLPLLPSLLASLLAHHNPHQPTEPTQPKPPNFGTTI